MKDLQQPIDLKVQVIYSGFKHAVQVRKTDFCIENLVSFKGMFGYRFLKLFSILKNKENKENMVPSNFLL